ncbi:hypothetical protein [Lysobacter gummosus]|uniref:hypothetical protein n=1 Tax=Lysobacter gummosus TaxID=262324 RepID=UPI003642A251
MAPWPQPASAAAAATRTVAAAAMNFLLNIDPSQDVVYFYFKGPSEGLTLSRYPFTLPMSMHSRCRSRAAAR